MSSFSSSEPNHCVELPWLSVRVLVFEETERGERPSARNPGVKTRDARGSTSLWGGGSFDSSGFSHQLASSTTPPHIISPLGVYIDSVSAAIWDTKEQPQSTATSDVLHPWPLGPAESRGPTVRCNAPRRCFSEGKLNEMCGPHFSDPADTE